MWVRSKARLNKFLMQCHCFVIRAFNFGINNGETFIKIPIFLVASKVRWRICRSDLQAAPSIAVPWNTD